MGNVHLAYFYIFHGGDFSGGSTAKEITEQFQAFNGLKCSTVGGHSL